jgi:hypothetical protein
MLDRARAFVVHGDSSDLNRGLVCGMIWLSRGMAVNIQQMRLLTSKCKSSINGSFGNLGYGTIPAGADSAGELIAKCPFMKSNFSELRQWTMRQLLQEKVFAPAATFSIDLDDPKEDMFSLSAAGLEEALSKMLMDDISSGSSQYESPAPSCGGQIGSELDGTGSIDGSSFDDFGFRFL